jgi:hypothetical protein
MIVVPLEIAVALVGLGGVVVGAVIAGGFQWWTSRQTIAADRVRLHEQMHGEARLRREEQWRTELRSALAELLAATDPEGHPSDHRDRIVRHTHAVDLLLDQRFEDQNRLRESVINLSTSLTDTGGRSSVFVEPREVRRLQNVVYQAARAILNRPAPDPPTPA